MFLERTNIRIEMTIGLSIVLHVVLLGLWGLQRHATENKLQLKEVEFVEETETPPTGMEKLINKLVPPAPPAASKASAQEAEALLTEQSFSKVVGLQAEAPHDVSPIDLTKLAKLPAADFSPAIEKSPPSQPAGKKIALLPSERKSKINLESKVVALTELPAADFDLDIQRNKFQQPEQIIKQVKAERRKATTTNVKKLSLNKASFIEGAVKHREIIRQATPKIPRWLEEKGIEAQVVIRFSVDPDGEVNDRMIVERTSGYEELDRNAMKALKSFIFAPLPLTAKQVEEKGTITFRFTFVH